MECNPKPRTLDYPDCRTYGVKRLENDRGCRPARLSLDVTGYQAISDGLIVKVQWEEGAVPRAKLLLERVEYSLGKNTLKPGMLMGTLVFEKGGPREMLLGVGMLGYTSQKTARRTEEP